MNILKYPWHIGHDFELYKMRHKFFVLASTHRSCSTSQRPIPDNVTFVPSADCTETDVMILHLDQWSLLELDKRQLFAKYRDSYPNKKVVIIHGCNMLDGCSSAEMREFVQDLPVVCNSSVARDLWAIPNSAYVRHGMSPEEWPSSNYGRNNIVVVQPPPGLHDVCRNGAAVANFESERGIKVDWVGRDRKFDNFYKYRSFLGSSSIFFNPSYASANPRSRTEAMLCGLAVVTTKAQGEDYIINGENGFASNDMEELYDFLDFLHRNPQEVRRIGRAGQSTARDIFHIDRFTRRWDLVLGAVMEGNCLSGLQNAISAC